MDLCDSAQVKALLARHGFHFSKSKGQNFLTQEWVPREIVHAAGIDRSCGVLEVGPGIGPLTQQLCLSAGNVVAIELDRTLAPVLSETTASFDNLTLIFGDVMKTELSPLLQAHFSGLRPVACANLPYYITSPVLSRLLESEQFSSITVMVQKEVAQRICASPGSPEYSAFSVFCNYYARPVICFEVPPSCFLPQPKVTSAVLRLDVRSAPPCEILSRELFFRVVRASFAQRRKTLLNALSAGFPQLAKPQISELLLNCGCTPGVRGETLGIAQFAEISNTLFRSM